MYCWNVIWPVVNQLFPTAHCEYLSRRVFQSPAHCSAQPFFAFPSRPHRHLNLRWISYLPLRWTKDQIKIVRIRLCLFTSTLRLSGPRVDHFTLPRFCFLPRTSLLLCTFFRLASLKLHLAALCLAGWRHKLLLSWFWVVLAHDFFLISSQYHDFVPTSRGLLWHSVTHLIGCEHVGFNCQSGVSRV